MKLCIVGGVLCLIPALQWLGINAGWPGEGTRFTALMALLAVLCVGGLVVALTAGGQYGARIDKAARSFALGLAVLAAAGPFLLRAWIQSDYIWVINQGFPCSTMGSGPGMLWVLVSCATFAVGAIAYSLGGGVTRRTALAGVGLGASLVMLTAIAMFPDRQIFAWVLGCL